MLLPEFVKRWRVPFGGQNPFRLKAQSPAARSILCMTSPLPRIEGMALVIPTGPDVQADLLYRLREQAPDVCETDADSAQQAAARCRSALKLADKIQATTQEPEMTRDPYK